MLNYAPQRVSFDFKDLYLILIFNVTHHVSPCDLWQVTELTQFLIEHPEILGENVPNLLGTDEGTYTQNLRNFHYWAEETWFMFEFLKRQGLVPPQGLLIHFHSTLFKRRVYKIYPSPAFQK